MVQETHVIREDMPETGKRKSNFYRDNRDIVRNRSNKPRALNFEKYASEGNRFIHEVAVDMDTDRNTAARVTRAVLHALRDRLPADDAIQFAQGLPMALKGVFIDQYDPSKAPVVIRRADQFLDFIYHKGGAAAFNVFPDKQAIARALGSVFFVLETWLDYGQTDQIKHILGKEITDLIYRY